MSKLILKLLYIGIVVYFLTLLLPVSIRNYRFLSTKKDTVAEVISYNIPDSGYPTTYNLKVKFYDVYEGGYCIGNVKYKSDKEPSNLQAINILYGKSESRIFVSNKERVTWGTLMWNILVVLLLILFILLTLKDIGKILLSYKKESRG